MKIGILSDTHDDAAATERALAAFVSAGCGLIVHAGDICSPFTARLIKGCPVPHLAVFGNNDGDRIHLAMILDIRPAPRYAETQNTRIVIFHEPFINDQIDPRNVDLLIYGHTHQLDFSEREGMQIINPGTVAGVLASAKTCALFDTETRKAEIIEL
ncbi:MAG: YfcE family phosphodiesterase [Syntrophaceae bacterium]